MKYENLSNPSKVAKHFQTTPQNIRKTYRGKRPKAYDAQCVGAYILENGLTADEIVIAVETFLSIRDRLK